MLNYLSQKLRESFNAQQACKFFVGQYASIEIVMVLNRKCRLNSSRQPTVCYKCSDENLLFYSTITVLREIKKNYLQWQTLALSLFLQSQK